MCIKFTKELEGEISQCQMERLMHYLGRILLYWYMILILPRHALPNSLSYKQYYTKRNYSYENLILQNCKNCTSVLAYWYIPVIVAVTAADWSRRISAMKSAWAMYVCIYKPAPILSSLALPLCRLPPWLPWQGIQPFGGGGLTSLSFKMWSTLLST